MRLASSVVVEHGYKRSALYDLANNRVQRIPLELGAALAQPHLYLTKPQEKWAFYLEENGFLINEQASLWRPYRSDFLFPRIPKLHTLSVDLHAALSGEFVGWLLRSTNLLSMTHIVVMTEDGRQIEAYEFLKNINKLRIGGTYEILEERVPGALVGTLFDGNLTPRLQRTGSPSQLNNRDFICADTQVYSLTRQYSELVGNLHCDAEGCIFSHKDEKTYLLGTTSSQLSDILSSERYRRASKNTKDLRDQCKYCELRYVCIHPFTYRLDPHNIQSSPSLCVYDPCAEAPQNQLFAEAP